MPDDWRDWRRAIRKAENTSPEQAAEGLGQTGRLILFGEETPPTSADAGEPPERTPRPLWIQV